MGACAFSLVILDIVAYRVSFKTPLRAIPIFRNAFGVERVAYRRVLKQTRELALIFIHSRRQEFHRD